MTDECILLRSLAPVENGYPEPDASAYLLSGAASVLCGDGRHFTSVMPEAKETLIQSMTVFGVSMGALIGVPPSLVEIYGSKIRQVYKSNGFRSGLDSLRQVFLRLYICFA